MGQDAGLYGTEPGLALSSTVTIVVFAVLVWSAARHMNNENSQRRKAEIELRELNAELKERVAERTKNLRQTEARLQLLSERLSLATTVAKVGVWEWDLASNTVRCNNTMLAIYGFSPDPRVLGEEWLALTPFAQFDATLHPDDLPAVHATQQKVIAEKGEGSAEFRMTRTDGCLRHIPAIERAVCDELGNVTRMISVNIDVTESKQAEDALFEEKERAQVTLNSIGDAVICTNISGNITFLNLVAEKMTGWPLPEAFGRPMAEVFRIIDTSRGTIAGPMETAVGENRIVHLPADCVLVRRDGFETPKSA